MIKKIGRKTTLHEARGAFATQDFLAAVRSGCRRHGSVARYMARLEAERFPNVIGAGDMKAAKRWAVMALIELAKAGKVRRGSRNRYCVGRRPRI
jgi:hypothetical protein